MQYEDSIKTYCLMHITVLGFYIEFECRNTRQKRQSRRSCEDGRSVCIVH